MASVENPTERDAWRFVEMERFVEIWAKTYLDSPVFIGLLAKLDRLPLLDGRPWEPRRLAAWLKEYKDRPIVLRDGRVVVVKKHPRRWLWVLKSAVKVRF